MPSTRSSVVRRGGSRVGEKGAPIRSHGPAYAIGRIALLGDAAHAITPNLGQGACRALGNAVTLAAALATEPSVEAAPARYDAVPRPRRIIQPAFRSAGPRSGRPVSGPAAQRRSDGRRTQRPRRPDPNGGADAPLGRVARHHIVNRKEEQT
ncbi:FAD-dependent monooxygenase [Streptomyces sp. NPDC058279]|uniref:FAD-dependent monooxygenase n=1 Tax=Streptomyces sp. NPDC058279 TaxID=3346418 RepID=UPI0036E99D19